METKDFILRYGFAAGKRYTRRQKLRFLMGLTQDLEELGCRVEAKETEGNQIRNVNLYVGETGKARVIAEAYYDTPSVSLVPGGYRFFSEKYRKNELMISIFIPMLLILAAGALFFWRASASLFAAGGGISVAGVLNIVVLLVLLTLMYRCRRGVGRKRNVVRNTSSILALYRLAEREKKNRRLAMTLTDNGCGANIGAKVLHERKGRDQLIVHLDCVGAQEKLYLLYDSGRQSAPRVAQILQICGENGIEALDIRTKPDWKLEYFEDSDLYLLAGTPGKSGFCLDRKRLSQIELSEENIDKAAAFLSGLEKILR
ncbi:MAG TPA: hypothetical protein IAD39_03770 [Candidatus Merdisoma faecalis]|nr:hypothetical protein [Candidatus Merdisoma faecalis]